MDLNGKTLEDKYEVRAEIGRTAMSIVYRAFHRVLHKEVAIKLPTLNPINETEFRQRFQKEIQTIAQLQHPAMIAVYDAGLYDQRPYLVMEYLPGGSLEDRLGREGRLSPAEVARIVGQVAEALDYAHGRTIVHRDIKPGNILLDADGNPKLGDFGLLKIAASSISSASRMIGTPSYMAPEQIEGTPIGPGADIYALGVLTYELLTGQLPFHGTMAEVCAGHLHRSPRSLRDLNPTLAPALDIVVLRALSKHPADRYPTARAFAAALAQACNESPPQYGLQAPHIDEFIGRTIDKYKVIRLLGEGGMGRVYLAEDEKLHREVALKIPHRALLHQERFIRDFQHEAQGAAQLQHPSIITIYETDQVERVPFIVMEYASGGTLTDMLNQVPRLSPDHVARLVTRIARGLDYAHARQFVHRDIKPQNILIDEEGAPKIGDFGLVKFASSSLYTVLGNRIGGTPAYMAPEQVRGEEVGASADIYALGVMAYELLTGQLPFQGGRTEVSTAHLHKAPPSLRELNPALSADLDRVVLRALNKAPHDRYPTAGAFAEALSAAAAGQPIPADNTVLSPEPDSRPAKQPSPPARQRPWRLLGGGALALLALLLVAGLSWSHWEHRRVLAGLQQQGDAALAAGRIAEAQARYEEALAANPRYAPALAQVALIHLLADKDDAAEQAARAAVAADGRSAIAHARLAEALVARYRYDEARAAAERAVALDPELPESLSVRGLVKAIQADATADKALLADGAADADAALTFAADQEAGSTSRALAHARRGDIYLYEYFAEHDPARENLLLERAQTQLAQAASLQPSLATYANALGDVAYYQAQHAERNSRAEEAESLREEALEHYNRALELDPGFALAQSNIGWVHLERDQLAAAGEAFQAALKINPDEVGAYLGQSRLFRDQEQPDLKAAVAALIEARTREPENFRIFTELGWTYREAWLSVAGGDTRELAANESAEEAFRQALELNPRDAWALAGLGWVRQDRQEYADAEQSFRQALALVEHREGAHNGLGWSLYGLGRYAEAEPHFRRAVDLNSSFIDALYGLGQTRERLGRFEQARVAYRQALNLDEDSTNARAALDTLGSPVSEGQVWGPNEAALAHDDDNEIENFPGFDALGDMPQFEHLIAEATFVNPYDAAEGAWDYGFILQADDSAQYRIFITSSGTWEINEGSNGLASRTLPTAAALRTESGAANRLRLIVQGATVRLFVNDAPVELESPNLGQGRLRRVLAATGITVGTERPGATTLVRDFIVWELRELTSGRSGELEHTAGTIGGNVEGDGSGNRLVRNVLVEARFINPYAANNATGWDYGFLFRNEAEGRNYRLAIESGGSWELTSWNGEGVEAIAEGPISTDFNTEVGQANRLLLIVRGSEGLVYLNDSFLTRLELDESLAPGSLYAATGFSVENIREDATTAYRDLTIWTIAE